MNDHFTVTIHDDNGVKQYNVHQLVKKAIVYAVLFFAFIGFVAIGTILYLNNTVDKIEKKRLEIRAAYAELKLKNEKLKHTMLQTQAALNVKKEELSEVSDSLSEIETLIGITPVEEMSLQKRVNLTKLNSEQMATLLQFIPNGSPIVYKGITSKFGYRLHPTLKKKEFHRGSDMKAKMNTPVYATADGVIEYAGNHKKSGYGKLIIIRHNYGFTTYFGHLNKIVIKSGKFVRKGDLIAYTGNSGMSNGPHLHYEVRFIQRPLNPYWFVKWTVQNYQEIFEKEKKVPWQSLIAAIAHIKILNPTQIQPLSQQEQLSKGR